MEALATTRTCIWYLGTGLRSTVNVSVLVEVVRVMMIEATDATFNSEVAASTVPVVLEVYATWCGNCRKIAPALEALAEEFTDGVLLVKVNADENPDLVARFSVSSTPTLIALDGEREVTRVVGAQRAPVLRELFTTATGATGQQVRTNWVPAEACTLPTADQPLRLAEFDDLFSEALHAAERHSPTWLQLRLSDGEDVVNRARDLTAREVDCCDFFDFSIRRDAHQTVLDVRVPAARAVVLDGLAEQANAALVRA